MPPQEILSEKGKTDRDLIKGKVLDYIEAWYQGDAERGVKSLHPELAKRIVRGDLKTGQSFLDEMGASKLADRWRSGDGKATPKEGRKKMIAILDLFGNMASVKLEASGWVDYMHLAKYNNEWLIVNILWELKQ